LSTLRFPCLSKETRNSSLVFGVTQTNFPIRALVANTFPGSSPTFRPGPQEMVTRGNLKDARRGIVFIWRYTAAFHPGPQLNFPSGSDLREWFFTSYLPRRQSHPDSVLPSLVLAAEVDFFHPRPDRNLANRLRPRTPSFRSRTHMNALEASSRQFTVCERLRLGGRVRSRLNVCFEFSIGSMNVYVAAKASSAGFGASFGLRRRKKAEQRLQCKNINKICASGPNFKSALPFSRFRRTIRRRIAFRRSQLRVRPAQVLAVHHPSTKPLLKTLLVCEMDIQHHNKSIIGRRTAARTPESSASPRWATFTQGIPVVQKRRPPDQNVFEYTIC